MVLFKHVCTIPAITSNFMCVLQQLYFNSSFRMIQISRETMLSIFVLTVSLIGGYQSQSRYICCNSILLIKIIFFRAAQYWLQELLCRAEACHYLARGSSGEIFWFLALQKPHCDGRRSHPSSIFFPGPLPYF